MFAGVLRPFRAEHSILQKSEKKRDRHSRQSAYCLIEQRGYSAITPIRPVSSPSYQAANCPGVDTSLRLVEKQEGSRRTDKELGPLQRLPVTDPHHETTAFALMQLTQRIGPMNLRAFDPQGLAVKSRMRIALSDVDHVLLHIGRQYKQRLLPCRRYRAPCAGRSYRSEPRCARRSSCRHAPYSDTEGPATPDRPSCRAAHIWAVGPNLVDISPLGSQFLLQEDRQIDLSDKTDPLRILALGRGQFLFGSQTSHLGLQQMADRKDGPRQLLLRELTQEITLILVGIDPGQQTVDGRPVGSRLLARRQ